MTEEVIPQNVEIKVFESLELNGIERALAKCEEAGYRALFMPEIVDTRIISPDDSYIFKKWFTVPSIKATGRTKGGNPVVIYGHVPNYFSKSANVREARERGLVNGAGIMPLLEFYRLLDLEDGENVFVVDYNILMESESGVVWVSNALRHPQTIPFLGGEERAERYLKKHEEVYGPKIGIWHCDDLWDEPVGRWLYLSNNYDVRVDGLYDYDNLDSDGCVLGIGNVGEVVVPQKIGLVRCLKAVSEKLGYLYAPEIKD